MFRMALQYNCIFGRKMDWIKVHDHRNSRLSDSLLNLLEYFTGLNLMQQ